LVLVQSAELAQRGHLPADVAGELVQAVHRDEQLVAGVAALAGRVLHHHVLPARATDRPFEHFHELADAVLVVHHHVARGQRQRVHLVATLGRQPSPVGVRCGAVAGEVGLGDHHQLRAGQHQPVGQAAAQHRDVTWLRLSSGLTADGGDLGLDQALQHPLRRPVPGHHHRGRSTGAAVRAQRREGGGDLRFNPPCGRDLADVEVQHACVVAPGQQRAQRPPRCPLLLRVVGDLVE